MKNEETITVKGCLYRGETGGTVKGQQDKQVGQDLARLHCNRDDKNIQYTSVLTLQERLETSALGTQNLIKATNTVGFLSASSGLWSELANFRHSNTYSMSQY